MATWAEDIATALEQLGGVAPLSEIYERVRNIRPEPHPVDLGALVRGTIERNSSDSTVFAGKDIFFSYHGIGGGVWGLRSYEKLTVKALDIELPSNEIADRKIQETYRILRDTKLARQLKLLYKDRCQLCNLAIELANGELYSEAHHIKPLGRPHNGPDIAQNIIVLCPNHHVMLDYGSLRLEVDQINLHKKHNVGSEFIDYHNNKIHADR